MSVIRAGRLAVAASMSEFAQSLLDESPRVRDPVRQGLLTARYLSPALPHLDALLRHVRAELDPGLRHALPPGPKAYPLGRCREITEAVLARLDGLDPADLPAPAAAGLAALRAFQAEGGAIHRAWGDLRGRYFQNALIVGTLYVDAANDTVFTDKPPVEILPFAQAGFRPIASYAHYARIAAGYWGLAVQPNHLAPQLAPYLPLLEISAAGAVRFGPTNRTLLGLTLAGGFAPSARALAAPPMSEGLFAGLRAALQPAAVTEEAASRLAASPLAGRADALAACEALAAAGETERAGGYNAAMAAARALNARLAGVRVAPRPLAAVA